MKRYLFFLLLLGILSLSLSALAASPENYMVTYMNTDEDQQATIEKYYISDSNKMRIETIKNDTIREVELLRWDKKAWYIIYPAQRMFSLQIAEEGRWNALLVGAPISKLGRKTGQMEFLGLTCDIYERKSKSSSSWSLVSREYGICLKKVDKEKGKIVNQIEAKEFLLSKPEASLFELPSGYIASVQYGD